MSTIPSELKRAIDKSVDAQNALVKTSRLLDAAVANSSAHGLPAISIPAAQGSYMSILCQVMRATSVLEIGTLGGYSTIWLATSHPNIHVTSIEYDKKHYDVARENTKALDNIDIIHGAALDVLPKLAEQGRIFDFIFIDADWDEQQQYFEWVVKLSHPGSCIVVDNAVRQLTESPDGEGRELVDFVAKDERVQATLMMVVNTSVAKVEKADPTELADGFVMAVVK